MERDLVKLTIQIPIEDFMRAEAVREKQLKPFDGFYTEVLKEAIDVAEFEVIHEGENVIEIEGNQESIISDELIANVHSIVGRNLRRKLNRDNE